MNGWKVTAIGAGMTTVVTGLIVVGSIGGHRAVREHNIAQPAAARVASAFAIPSRSDVTACNKYAASEAAMIEAGAVGAAGGSVYGLDESKKQDERYRVAYASCMRARGFAT